MSAQSFTYDPIANAYRPTSKAPSWPITLVIAVWVFGITMALGFASKASADVDLTELYTVDGVDYPVCQLEDCSDQPGQVGLWLDEDTGNWWLSTGDTSVLVIDDTVTEG